MKNKSESPKLAIYQSTFGFSCMRIKNGIPIEVGAHNRENFIYQLRDNTGDNISDENEYYGELTGIYWLWKNVKMADNDLIGFCHYNKALKINEKDIQLFFKSNPHGWIVSHEKEMPKHSDQKEWEAFCAVIQKLYPDYFLTLQLTYKGDGYCEGCNCANMFITTWKQFSSYCKFVFDICSDLRCIVGNNKKDKFDRRYCAFLAERLLTIYIRTEKLPCLKVKVCYAKQYVKIIMSIANILHLKKESHLYKAAKKWMLKGSFSSSYRR